MDYFLLSTTGDLNDRTLCLVDSWPDDMEDEEFRLSLGREAKEYFPEDAKIHLKPERPGVKLAGLLGNTHGYLIASKTAKEIVEELCPKSQIEYFPFTLYNHKGRVHSSDYFFINPIGGLDCLNEKASGVVYNNDGDVRSIKELILDPEKIKTAPHLFRIAQDRIKYVISKQLGETFAQRGVTNIRGTPLRVEA